MGFDDIMDSAPSVAGAAMSGWAAAVMPGAAVSAWILTAMQVAAISDPAQMAHAASSHDALATKISGFKTQLDDAVNKQIPPAQLTSDDKNALVKNQVEPAKAALDATAKAHTTIADALRSQASSSTTIGRLSSVVGAAMLTLALSTTAQEATLFGIPAALAEQAEGSSMLSTLFQRALVLLKSVAGLVAKLLMAKGVAISALGMLDVSHILSSGSQMSAAKPVAAPMQVMSTPTVAPA
jgi:hypothetical protein